jgi:pimeloyl-ACP methyl ester carboxylesterase
METRRRQLLLGRVPYDEMEHRLRLNELCNHRMLLERQSFDEVVRAKPECRPEITYPQPYTYMQQWASVDLVDEWKKVTAPVLIVYGLSDFVATVTEHPYLRDVIESFHPGRATLKAIPGMDHGMSKAASMEESFNWPRDKPRELETAAFDAIRDWLEKQAAA